MPSILVGGDVCPTGPNEPLFRAARADAIFNDLLPEFERADFRVVNLECPLVAENHPIRKVGGPVLRAARDCVSGLVAAGIDAVGLANNHIMDQGEAGLRSTIEVCVGAGIGCFGAGPNLAAAGRILVREVGGLRVGFYGIADSWFGSVAGADRWGANPRDTVEVARSLRRELPGLDFLVVLLHAGSEHYPYPSPGLRRFCRFLAEAGAGAVICQHSHCAGSYEHHEGVPIVYGQGNLVFSSPTTRATWHEGFLVRLNISGAHECSAEWVPHCQSPGEPGVRRMAAAREKEFRAELARRSREMEANGFVEREWTGYCRQKKRDFENDLFHPYRSRLLRVLSRRLPSFGKWLRPNRSRLMLRYYVQCETHREVLLTMLADETDTPRSGGAEVEAECD